MGVEVGLGVGDGVGEKVGTGVSRTVGVAVGSGEAGNNKAGVGVKVVVAVVSSSPPLQATSVRMSQTSKIVRNITRALHVRLRDSSTRSARYSHTLPRPKPCPTAA